MKSKLKNMIGSATAKFAALLLAVACVGTSATAWADTWTWKGGDGAWFSDNWSHGSDTAGNPGTEPTDDVVISSGAVTYTPGGDWAPKGKVTISNGASLTQITGNAWPNLAGNNGQLILDNGTYNGGTAENLRLYTLSASNGSKLLYSYVTTFSGDVTLEDSEISPNANADANANLTFSGDLTLSGDSKVETLGTLTWNGKLTLSGGSTVSAATVTRGADSSLVLNTGSMMVDGLSNVTVNGGSLTVTGGDTALVKATDLAINGGSVSFSGEQRVAGVTVKNAKITAPGYTYKAAADDVPASGTIQAQNTRIIATAAPGSLNKGMWPYSGYVFFNLTHTAPTANTFYPAAGYTYTYAAADSSDAAPTKENVFVDLFAADKAITYNGSAVADQTAFDAAFVVSADTTAKTVSATTYDTLDSTASGNYTLKEGAYVKLADDVTIGALAIESADAVIDLNDHTLTVSSLTIAGEEQTDGDYTDTTLPSVFTGTGTLTVGNVNKVIAVLGKTGTKTYTAETFPTAFTKEGNPDGSPILMTGNYNGDVITIDSTFTGKSLYLNGWTINASFNITGLPGGFNIYNKLAGADQYYNTESDYGTIAASGVEGNYPLQLGNGGGNVFINSGVKLKATAQNGVALYSAGRTISVYDGAYLDGNVETVDDGRIYIQGGTVTGTLKKESGSTVGVSGGTFDNDPAGFLADGYKASQNASGKYVVELDTSVATLTPETDGTYLLKTPLDVIAFRTMISQSTSVYAFSGETVKLANDIDLTGYTLKPTGNNRRFCGVFDGQGYTISNMTIDGAGQENVAFFCNINDGRLGTVIKNVTFNNATVVGGKFVGVIVGRSYGDAQITNCKVTGLINITATEKHVGVILGGGVAASVANCEVIGDTGSTITTTVRSVGGLIGTASDGFGEIRDNTVSGLSISSSEGSLGGLIGRSFTDGPVVANNSISNVELTSSGVGENCPSSLIIGETYVSKDSATTYYTNNTVSDSSLTIAGVSADNLYSPAAYNSEYVIISDPVAQIGETKYRTFAEAIVAAEAYKTENGVYPQIVVLDETAALDSTMWKIDSGYLVRRYFYQDADDATLWHVENLDGLKEFRDSVNAGTSYAGKTIQLDNPVDLADENWTPIGSDANKFSGVFDGNGKTVSNLTINDSTLNNAGLFGYANKATFKNVKFENVSITANNWAGALVGQTRTTPVVVENCSVTGTINISGNHYVGGLAGQLYGVNSVSGCSVDGGDATKSIIHAADHVANSGDGDDVGGITGFAEPGNIADCSVKNVTLEGFRQVGGIVGLTSYGKITDATVEDVVVKCIADENTVATQNKKMGFGGVVGAIRSTTTALTIDECTVSGVSLESNETGLSSARMGYITGGLYNTDTFDVPEGTKLTVTDVAVENCTRVAGTLLPTPSSTMPVDGYLCVAAIGTTGYTTLAAAVAAATDGDTITLLADCTASGIRITKSLTVDGCGKTVTSTTNYPLLWVANADAEVWFENLNIVHDVPKGSSSAYSIYVTAAKKVVVDNCSIDAVYYGVGIVTADNASVEVKDSSISGYGALYLMNARDCTVDVANSTLTGNNRWASTPQSDFATVMIMAYNGTSSGNVVNLTDTVVNAETVANKQVPFCFYYGSDNQINVSGNGSKVAWLSEENDPIIQDFGTGNAFTVYGGIFAAEVPAQNCAEGYGVVANTDDATKEAYPYTVALQYVAKIERDGEATQYFATLAAAVAEAEDGDTVVLLADVEVSAANSTLPAITVEKNIDLDLNGQSITSPGTIGAFLFRGTSRITDSVGGGSINTRYIDNYGSLVLDGVTYNENGSGGVNAFRNFGPLLAISNSTVTVNSQFGITSRAGADDVIIYNSTIQPTASNRILVALNSESRTDLVVENSTVSAWFGYRAYRQGSDSAPTATAEGSTVLAKGSTFNITNASTGTANGSSAFAAHADNVTITIEDTDIALTAGDAANDSEAIAFGSSYFASRRAAENFTVTVDADSSIAFNGVRTAMFTDESGEPGFFSATTVDFEVEGATLKAQVEASGYATVAIAEKPGWYKVCNPVASITVDGITTPYATFADAIAAAEEYADEHEGEYPQIVVLDATAEQTNPGWKIDNGYLVKKVYVAEVVVEGSEGESKKYETLAEAFDDIYGESGVTVKLLADTTFDDFSWLEADCTVDFDGHTLTFTDSACLSIDETYEVVFKNGAIVSSRTNKGTAPISIAGYEEEQPRLVLNDTTVQSIITPFEVGEGGTMVVSNSTIATSGTYGIAVGGGTLVVDGGTVTGGDAGIYMEEKSSVTISAGSVTGGQNGIVIFGNGDSEEAPKLTIAGGTVTGTAWYGVSGNGTIEGGVDYSETVVSVSGGTVSGGIAGIYNPQKGTLTISGGSVTGVDAAVWAKSGNVAISDGAFMATGETGDALRIEAAGYPGGDPTATLTGGIFSSKPSDDYCASGYEAVANTDEATKEAYPWTVKPVVIITEADVVIDGNTATITTMAHTTGNKLWVKGGSNETWADSDITGRIEHEGDPLTFSGVELPTTAGEVRYYTITKGSTDTLTDETVEGNVIGVLRVDSALTNTIIAVPWTKIGGGAVTVSNLVATATLTEGDTLQAYDKTTRKFYQWTLNANGNWEASKTVGGEGVEVAEEADDYTIPRGAGVWLTRQNPEQPLYLIGEVATGDAVTALDTTKTANTDGKQSWNLVAPPTAGAFNLNGADKGITPVGTFDRILVPTATVPRNYTYKDGKWGYYKTTVENGRVTSEWRADENATVPAGTGFWYLNSSSSSEESRIDWSK